MIWNAFESLEENVNKIYPTWSLSKKRLLQILKKYA